ncbi:dihydrodipicolinate synthase [Rubidibacter lacunae KORDI 51-2]|uniref:4-hydroxy-tetrahydrodipicolinate synthase n=1 Tax=Rubidibacter lacunae KORDI 51-2 TaxID=582515 RepID=U5DF95_9CHRO|nr:4-hydroxy-tetrahydrodipicolinate synthase [Rubidibacter lacunae]ERN43163.1 dihydrodipicolinate synthase [Rubidibacter lacunae KORDI 51-2]
MTDSSTTGAPFGRTIAAMVTPFGADGNVDYAVAERLAVHLLDNGNDALVICGTTGESPTLTWDEEYRLFQVVQAAVGDRAPVLAGTGSNSTREAIAATEKAAKLGMSGTLQVVPYYNKPPQAGLYAHFRAIARACPELPLMLYNVPGRTSRDLAAETVADLAEIDNIVAIKDASGSVERAAELRRLTPPEFAIYSGEDALTLPMLAVGGAGVVSVASHVAGVHLQTMIRAFFAGDVNTARDLHLRLMPLFSILFATTNPIPIKAALRLQGWPVGTPRLPLGDIPSNLQAQLSAVLEELGVL